MSHIKNLKFFLIIVLLSASYFFISNVYALTFNLPPFGENVVGTTQIIQSQPGDTLYSLARHYEMGNYEMQIANPGITRYGKIKPNTPITIPSSFVLPNVPHRDIVINLPELRLYYFPAHRHVVITEPISIGKPGWPTPLMHSSVVEKIKDPYWMVPETIAEYSAQKGIFLPPIVSPGPDNPLGHYALRLGQKSILIHGTNQSDLIGKRVSSGCIRMYPEDIANLFLSVPKNTPVIIMDQPFKLGWLDHKVYLEAHPLMVDSENPAFAERDKLYQDISNAMNNYMTYINWDAVNSILKQTNGIPNVISG